MGTSTSVAQFAARIDKYQQAVGNIGSTAVKINAATAKANAEEAVRAATNGSSRLRNVGKNGSKLSVSTKIEEDRATVRAVGPWQLIEYPTKQHFIGPAGVARTTAGSRSGRSTAKARQGRAKAVRTPYGFSRFVYVRGTRGKLPWHHAFDKTASEASQGLSKAAQTELGKL